MVQVVITRAQARASGLPTFFPNTPCAYGHNSTRYTVNGHCTECAEQERLRRKALFSAGNSRVVRMPRISNQSTPTVEAPKVVEQPAPVESKPKSEPVTAHVLAPDPSIAHLYDRGLTNRPMRDRPNSGLIPETPAEAAEAPQKRSYSPRQPRVAAADFVGPKRPPGRPRRIAPPTTVVKAPTAPVLVSSNEPAEKTEADIRRENQRAYQQNYAKKRADERMAVYQKYASGNW